MHCTDIGVVKRLHKEVFIRKQPEDWNEINLIIGGVASNLQDIKVQKHSGAYVYKDNPNRFIFWRTDDSVLELVEESFDVTLHGNQVKYQFSESTILSGISVAETLSRVVVLVPTVCSLHIFTFNHPDKLNKKGLSEASLLSVFHGANEADASDPSSFHLLAPLSSAIVNSTSFFTATGEALFALSLTNSSVVLISIDTTTGATSTRTLSHETIVPRFLSGITDALLGKETGENVASTFSLVYIKKILYLLTLSRGGCLRAWSLEKGAFVSSVHLNPTNSGGNVKGMRHKICTGTLNGSLVVYCSVQGTAVVTVLPEYDDGTIKFNVVSEIPIPSGLDVREICAGQDGQLWCIWLTNDEKPVVTKYNVLHPDLTGVKLARPAFEVSSHNYLIKDPASLYFNAIFSSGFFSSSNVTKALLVYKKNAVIKPNVDICDQIYSIVESEVYSELGEQEVEDEEFLEVSNRCWSRLYSCCIHFVVSGMLPFNMCWMDKSLLLVQESGYSLVVHMDMLELFMTTCVPSSQYPQVGYGSLLEKIREVDLEAGLDRLKLSLHLGESLDDRAILKAAADLVQPSPALDTALSLFYEEDIDRMLNSLLEELAAPEEYNREGTCWDTYSSFSGMSAVVSMFRDFSMVRLKTCCSVLVMLELGMREDSELSRLGEAHQALRSLSKAYYVLHWTAVSTSRPGHVPLAHSYCQAHLSVIQPSLSHSVLSLAAHLWPLIKNDALAQHLLSTKQYALLETLARICGLNAWCLLLAECYILTGQLGKAYDICVKSGGLDVAHYLSAIRLFDRHHHSELVIAVATKALDLLDLSPTDKEMFESALFVHELSLGNYDAAWGWIESCSSWARRTDSLHRLVSEMIAERKYVELISFPYTGLLDELENFLNSRARLLPLSQAANYYNILYSFHVKHGNFKKASSVMLEKAVRSETAEMQWRCYGACLISLLLVSDPLHAWLVKPNPSSEEESLEILEIRDIQREFELANARYSLDGCPFDATKEEVVAYCVSTKHFKRGLRLASLCRLSCAPIIQAFTTASAVLTEGSLDSHWLRNNPVDDMILTEDKAVDICWRILERSINKYEKDRATLLHRAAADQLLKMGCYLPSWLLQSYKIRNSGELLRLYLGHGYLELAASLGCDLLRAGLGVGSHHFSMEEGLLLPTSSPLYLPLTTIELLLLELNENNLPIAKDVEKALAQYVDIAMRLTKEKPITVFQSSKTPS